MKWHGLAFDPNARKGEIDDGGNSTKGSVPFMWVILDIGASTLQLELGDGLAARQLAAALPLEITLSRWGDEYYGSLPVSISSGQKRRDVFEIGEVAYWPPGNALCVFFGPTPASLGKEPRMASPGIALGRIASGVTALRSRGPQLVATIRLPGRET